MDDPYWRWYSGSGAITYRNNLAYVLFVHLIAKNGGLLLVVKIKQLKFRRQRFSWRTIRWLFYSFIVNFLIFPLYFGTFFAILFLSAIWFIFEYLLMVILIILSLGTCFGLGLTSAYECFFNLIESIFGRTFKQTDITIRCVRIECSCTRIKERTKANQENVQSTACWKGRFEDGGCFHLERVQSSSGTYCISTAPASAATSISC